MPSPSPSHVGPLKPVYAGKQARGRIKSLTRGQGSGVISTSNGDVFFHKADFRGTFWDLAVGDQVSFELLNDTISGPRAQNVRRSPASKGAIKR